MFLCNFSTGAIGQTTSGDADPQGERLEEIDSSGVSPVDPNESEPVAILLP